MPKERRYGYMDIIDVAALIHTQGSEKWSEREWRKQLKETTSKRMSITAQSRPSTNLDHRRPDRAESESRHGVHYDGDSAPPSPSSRHQYNQSTDVVFGVPKKAVTAPANGAYLSPGRNHHTRSISESVAFSSPVQNNRQRENYNPSRLSVEYGDDMEPFEERPTSAHRNPFRNNAVIGELESSNSRYSSDSDGQGARTYPEDIQEDIREATPPAPVMAPPDMQHQASDVPHRRPDARPDLRREKSRMSSGTLSQIVEVNRLANRETAGHAGHASHHAAMVAWNNYGRGQGDEQGVRGVMNQTPHDKEIPANQPPCQELVALGAYTDSPADVRPPYDRVPSIPRKPLPATDFDSPDATRAYSTAQPDVRVFGVEP